MNDFLIALATAAEETGWQVIGYEGTLPGWVELSDASGTRVRITSQSGVGLVEQVRICKPLKPYQRTAR